MQFLFIGIGEPDQHGIHRMEVDVPFRLHGGHGFGIVDNIGVGGVAGGVQGAAFFVGGFSVLLICCCGCCHGHAHGVSWWRGRDRHVLGSKEAPWPPLPPWPLRPLVATGPLATQTPGSFSRLLLPDELGEGPVAGAALSRAPGLAVHPELPSVGGHAVAVAVGGVHC